MMGFTAPIFQIGDSFSKINMGFADRAVWILKVYSPEIVLGLLALLAIIMILVGLLKRVRLQEQKLLIPFGVAFTLLGLVLSAMIFIGDPGFEALRNFNFVFLLSIPFAAYALFMVFSHVSTKKFASLAIIFLLISLPYIVSLFSMYESPFINYPGNHVTYAQLDGMDWFFKNKNTSVASAKVSVAAPWRFSDVLYGVDYKDTRTDVAYNYDTTNWIDIPDHFENLIEAIPNRYILYNKMDYLTYTQVWPIRYSVSDFAGLENNKEVQALYANGDQVILYVP